MNRTLTILLAFLLAPTAILNAASYHLDATSGTDDGDGLNPGTAWRSLGKVNAFTFQPGDSLLLKAGSAWEGQLHPLGSGTAGHRITLDRYGEGPKPAIHGGGIQGGAVLLVNQQHWSIRNLEVTNQGSAVPKKMGILIRNDAVGDPRLQPPVKGMIGLDAVNRYKLRIGSPALAAGVLVKDNGGRDYWGNTVSGTALPHVGAFNGSAVKP